MPEINDLPAAIRAKRLALGMTQKELAAQYGYDRRTVQRAEAGRAGQTTLLIIAGGLGIPLDGTVLPEAPKSTGLGYNEPCPWCQKQITGKPRRPHGGDTEYWSRGCPHCRKGVIVHADWGGSDVEVEILKSAP